jgi:nitroreductase
MEVMDAILKRRSIRQFKNTPVIHEKVEILLRAAMNAPSAKNYQSWHFVIIEDENTLNKIPSVHPFAEMMNQAPLAILVCGDKSIEPSAEYNALNCAAATQNILLAAFNLGLGSVWLGVYPKEERIKGIKELLKLPDNVLPISLIAIGYANEEKPMVERFRPDRIHYNVW